MNKEIASRWTAALRSGDYKQEQHALSVDGGFCCLGVLCDIALKDGVVELTHGQNAVDGALEYNGETGILPMAVREWAGIQSKIGEVWPWDIHGCEFTFALTELNDNEGFSFNQIADVIDNFADIL